MTSHIISLIIYLCVAWFLFSKMASANSVKKLLIFFVGTLVSLVLVFCELGHMVREYKWNNARAVESQ